MKKKIISVICIFLAMSIVMIVSAFEVSNYNIRLGNTQITTQYPSFIEDNRMYVSIRNLCDILGIPIYWNEDKNEVHIDIYNKRVSVSDKTEYKEQGVIPDKETALIVGKAILEKYSDKQIEYETEDKIYYLEAKFLEEYNAWSVYQTFKYKYKGGWVVGDKFYRPTIIISKNTGEVISLNTYSMFID